MQVSNLSDQGSVLSQVPSLLTKLAESVVLRIQGYCPGSVNLLNSQVTLGITDGDSRNTNPT